MAQPNYDQIYSTYLQQQTAQQEAAAKPVIESLEAQRNPLQQRYANLISQLGLQQKDQEAGINRELNQEFAARGISPGSGLFSQTQNQRLDPLYKYYAAQTGALGIEQENALAQLNSQIAGAKSGFSQRAIDYAMEMAKSRYGQEYNAYQDEVDRAAKLAEAEKNRQIEVQKIQAYGNNGNGTPKSTKTQEANQVKAKFSALEKEFASASPQRKLQIQNEIYEFLRKGGTYAQQSGGVSGADYINSLGLSAEAYWSLWRRLEAAAKGTGAKTSQAKLF